MNERQADYVRQLLAAFFNRADFLSLFQGLGIEPYSDEELAIDDEPSATKARLARKLVTQVYESGRTEELVELGRQIRPEVDWRVIETVDAVETPPKPSASTPTRPSGPLPQGSRMPYLRNPAFTGRGDVLLAISRPLVDQTHRAPLVRSVQGPTGVGTTQLAVELCYRFGYFFSSVHWIDGSRPEGIGAEIAACGAALELSDWPDDLPAQIARTLREWQRPVLRLAVLDNIDDVAAAQVWLEQLSFGSLRLLVTTSRDDWPADARLEVFRPDESRELLGRYLSEERIEDADLDRLAERVGHLPLALDLVGRYLAAQSQVTTSGYLRRLGNAERRLGMPRGKVARPSAVASVSLSLVENRPARRLFLAAGHCAPDEPIPTEVFRRVGGLEQADCERELAALVELGLLSPGRPGIGPMIQPLLARFARTVAKADDAEEASQGGGAEGTSVLADLADVLGMLTYQATQADLAASGLLRPHLETAAMAADGAGLAQAGMLWNNLGYYRKMTGDYAGARTSFERALARNEALHGPAHPNVALDLNNLGLVLQDQGDLRGARVLIERALDIDRQAFGERHLAVASDLSNLAGVLQDQGDPFRAEEMFRRALAIFEDTLPADHPYVEIARQNLAGAGD
jgi:tetratricopeptide (TPR) repeat protein